MDDDEIERPVTQDSKDHADLIARDLASDGVANGDADAAWRAEIERRLASLDAGEVQTVPWSEARSRIFDRRRHDEVS